MPAASSLALRALFKTSISKLGLDHPAPVTAGLIPPAKALAVVAAARAAAGATLVVVPTDKDVEQLTADVRFFYAALEGSTEAGLDRAVLPFPSHQVDPYRGMQPHFRVATARARALHAIATGAARVAIASAAALLPRVSAAARMKRASIELKSGTVIEPLALADLLIDAGFTREDPVDEHGEFTIRGGIVDIFPAGDVEPVRLEFVGDMVETLRRYDPSSQRSTGPVDRLQVVPLRERFDDGADPAASDDPAGYAASPGDGIPLVDFLAESGVVRIVVSEHDQVEEQGARLHEQLHASFEDSLKQGRATAPAPGVLFVDWEEVSGQLADAPRLEELALDESARHVRSQPSLEYRGRLQDWVTEIKEARQQGETVLFVAATQGMAERTVEILQEYEVVAVPAERAEDVRVAAVLVTIGNLSRGFRLPDAALRIFAETDIFEEERPAQEKRRNLAKTFLSDLRDLKVGDLVVHVDHGIGEFVGLKQLSASARATADKGDIQEFLELKYHGDDKLFVPVERLDLVQKYTGGSRPALDKLGGTTWEKAKTRVKKAMRDMAEELLKLYAQRKAVAGHSFSPDTHWQEEFEGAFPYELTPDQATAVIDIKRDMETPTPMDRLLCGDVGYGKTEVAMRAAFKAVMDGKQVAVLAPTTVLAFQHQKTLRDRFAGFPVNVDMVSRFRTRQEQKEAIAGVESGKVDIIVGTHRLLSKDVVFKDLGLLVVDEEQRFGVVHKERIKQMRKRVDVLTMTATPIPRTLNMSLVGISDMSIIERAVRNELARGGQVYFVHNRVESIFSIGNLLQRLVPEAKIAIGHGQMGEDELERAMLGFVERRFDVLLATTIVENGLDIPNANTIIINRADRYGLSQLYQLRGRVGRSDRPAYAYLLIPPQESLSPVARKRLAAIREFSDLGSGFRVAALDLEIRGAGNLLGGEQSGHIEAVGFEMYMKLLEDTVRELKGEEIEDDVRATVNLGVDLKIEDGYVADMNQRLMVYRKVAAVRTEPELDAILADLRDRYGPPPPSVLNLAEYGRIRILADRLGVETIDREGRVVVIRFRPNAKADPVRLVKVVSEWPGAVLLPPASLKIDLENREEPKTPVVAQRGRRAPAWWTARATAGEVRPGFTKEEILRRPAEDPRAGGGMFERLEGLLRALSA